MSGTWFVQLRGPTGDTGIAQQWEITQTGTTVTVTSALPCPVAPGNVLNLTLGCAPFAGTIDPMTGIFELNGWRFALAADGTFFTTGALEYPLELCDEEICCHVVPGCQQCCSVSVFLEIDGSHRSNGVVDPGEQCDDGNTVDGDGCDNNCTVTGCGNGIRTAGEACDDGNADDGDACKSDCTPNVCGDGVRRTGVEECDDGNLLDGDGCDSNCKTTGCGNSIVSAGEQCDDGNLVDGDGCDGNCTPTACGNGVRTGTEECDDGNTVDGDGCSAQCRREFVPGGGVLAVDCLHEWVTSPVPFERDSKLTGVPARRLECTDDQPCDLGSASGDHACTFLVGMCFNVLDPALQCTANTVGTVQVLQPRAGDRDPVAAGNRAALESALAGIGGHIQGVCRTRTSVGSAACTTDADCDTAPGAGVCLRLVSFGAGLTTANTCSAFAAVRVPVGRGRLGKVRLHLRTQTGATASTLRLRDTDTLTLICRRAF